MLLQLTQGTCSNERSFRKTFGKAMLLTLVSMYPLPPSSIIVVLGQSNLCPPKSHNQESLQRSMGVIFSFEFWHSFPV